MKIGIFTQPLHTNYGGLLQAYALQRTLKEMGHDVIVVNRSDYDYIQTSRFPRIFLGRLYHKILHKGKSPLFCNYLTQTKVAKIREFTNGFIERNIQTTKQIYSNKELLKYISNNKFDAFVVGSDQVWRPDYSPNIYTYFLDFADDKAIKLSYAASFGTDEWLFSKEQTSVCTELLRRFKSISVREDSAINLCSKYLHRDDAVLVLDPTLLLSKEDYISIIEKQSTPMSIGNLMTYVLDVAEDKQRIIDYAAKKKNLKPFSVIAKKDYSKSKVSIIDCIQPPVEMWLRGFMDAEYVIADSFHGCVFAIIFNKPFIAIGNHERGMARFLSLFKMFGLEDRLVYTSSEVTEEKINAPIDWEQVNRRRNELIAKSQQFLISTLKQ